MSAAVTENGNIGLPDDHGSRFSQARHDRRVVFRHEIDPTDVTTQQGPSGRCRKA